MYQKITYHGGRPKDARQDGRVGDGGAPRRERETCGLEGSHGGAPQGKLMSLQSKRAETWGNRPKWVALPSFFSKASKNPSMQSLLKEKRAHFIFDMPFLPVEACTQPRNHCHRLRLEKTLPMVASKYVFDL